jgi:hypothetical protein
VAFTFSIAASNKTIQPDWRISETMNGRNVMTFSVLSSDGLYRPSSRAVVAFAQDATTLFGGTVYDMDEAGLGGYGVTAIVTKVGAVDYNELPERRQVEFTVPAGSTLKQALTQTVAYLSGYSVTLDAAQANGPTLTDALAFEFGPLTAALNKLSVITGYAWEIDYSGVLSMFAPGTLPSGLTRAAPFNIAADDGNVIGDIAVSPSLSSFANTIIVRFTESARAAYAFLSATGNFSNGEQVVVGGRTYTFQTSLTDSNGNVAIGVDAETSLTNLAAAIVLGSGAGSAYAASMTVNGSVEGYMQSASLMAARALSVGSSGNTIACTTTAVDASWITEGGGATATLLFGADESLSNLVTATSGPAAADLVERVIPHPEVRDTAMAQALADGYLVRSLVTPREIRYTTLQSGVHPGQQQTIVESRRDLNATCLITAVDVTATGNVLRYDVTAVEGLVIAPSFMDVYRSWGGASTGVSGSVSLDPGGSTGISGTHNLGGTDVSSVPMAATPVARAVWNSNRFTARSSFTALIRVWPWARSAGVVATAILRNLTDSINVGTVVGDAVTSRPATAKTFNAAIVEGKEYELWIITDTASESGYLIGTLEAA